MKKIFFVCALAVAGFGLTACSSDDDSNNGTVNTSPMVGEWKAVELSYTMNPNDPNSTHTFPFVVVSQGCDVDELDLKPNYSAELEVENKVDDVCTEKKYFGSWDEEKITLDGINNKDVVSVSQNELVLKYVMDYGNYGTIEVTVKYVRS